MAKRCGRRAVALGAVACCVYAVVAWSTAGYWRDTVTLFRHTIEVTHDNWAAMTALSHTLLSANRVDEAMPFIDEALRLRPNLAEAHINYGAALSKRGSFDAALAEYGAALRLAPDNPDAQEGLGVVLTEKGRFQEALAHLNAAETIRPEDPDTHYNLGRLYGLADRPDLAAAQFAEAVRLEPESASAHFNLGTALAAQDRYRRSCRPVPRGPAPEARPRHGALQPGQRPRQHGPLRRSHRRTFRRSCAAQPDFPGAAQAIENCLELKKQSGH